MVKKSISADLQLLCDRVITLPGWRWMPGMSSDKDVVVNTTRVNPGVNQDLFVPDRDWLTWIDETNQRPDLLDPATVGCLLYFIAEKHGYDSYIRIVSRGIGGDTWALCKDGVAIMNPEPSRLHAIVAALELEDSARSRGRAALLKYPDEGDECDDFRDLADKTALKDCAGDGHYLCHKCGCYDKTIPVFGE